MNTTTLIGTAGALLIVIAFVMGQLHKWRDTSFVYDFVNLVGSALLIWYAWILKSYPFIVLNLVWLAVSFKDVLKGTM